jgi:glycosyltransferase involved in cell wall biosynthesis
VYIPNYIQPQAYTPQYHPGEYLFYFGRLAPEKGLDTLIRAANETDVKLLIAGTGPSEGKLRSLISDENDNIRFLGFCSGKKLHDLIRGARAVVLPSEWYENAPISLLEAYACGKIVIGARVGGIPELLVDGETGYLFESGNKEELKNQIECVYVKKDHEIEAMGKYAREHVIKHFTPKRYVDDMTILYSELGVNSVVT